MTIAELNSKVQFVTDVTGKRQAVLLELALWEEVLATLEKLEDEGAKFSRIKNRHSKLSMLGALKAADR